MQVGNGGDVCVCGGGGGGGGGWGGGGLQSAVMRTLYQQGLNKPSYKSLDTQ